MKILFATPPLLDNPCCREALKPGTWGRAPSLGLLYLAAAARQAGHDVSLLDCTATQLCEQEFIAHLKHYSPDVLALSATSVIVEAAGDAALKAKSASPKLLTILGGSHASSAPDETMARFPAIDFVVVGEGELTLVNLLAALTEKRSLSSVPGLYFRDGKDIISTGPSVPVADLDSLPPPAWDLLQGFPKKYAPAPFVVRQLPLASLVTSRGCPNRCIFCASSVFGHSCRFHSAESVVKMIEELHDCFGVREICFEDDTFVTDLSRVAEICHQLIDLGLGVSWSCLARVSQVSSEILQLMKRAGCWQVSFGIESGSQRILDTIGKNTTLAQISEAIALTRAAGMHARGFFIVGHPGESRETLSETIRFALSLPLNDVTVTLMTPFPGTELNRRIAEFGVMTSGWSELNESIPVFVPFGLTADDLLAAQRHFLRRFYLRRVVFIDYAGRLLRRPSLALPVLRGGIGLLRRSCLGKYEE